MFIDKGNQHFEPFFIFFSFNIFLFFCFYLFIYFFFTLGLIVKVTFICSRRFLLFFLFLLSLAFMKIDEEMEGRLFHHYFLPTQKNI